MTKKTSIIKNINFSAKIYLLVFGYMYLGNYIYNNYSMWIVTMWFLAGLIYNMSLAYLEGRSE